MFDFHEKRKIRSVLYSPIFIGLVFIVAGLIGMSAYARYEIEREMSDKLTERRTELDELQMRAEALESKVKHLTDERGIEEELRTRFDVAREGEEVVVLIEGDKKGTTTRPLAPVPKREDEISPFLKKVLFWRD